MALAVLLTFTLAGMCVGVVGGAVVWACSYFLSLYTTTKCLPFQGCVLLGGFVMAMFGMRVFEDTNAPYRE